MVCFADFINGLVSHFVLDDGKLVVAHAGMKEDMQGRSSAAVRSFSFYGETTGETDEFGLPIRYNWAGECRAGAAASLCKSTPIPLGPTCRAPDDPGASLFARARLRLAPRPRT